MSNLYIKIQNTLKVPYRISNLFRYQIENLKAFRNLSKPPDVFRELIQDEIQKQLSGSRIAELSIKVTVLKEIVSKHELSIKLLTRQLKERGLYKDSNIKFKKMSKSNQ